MSEAITKDLLDDIKKTISYNNDIYKLKKVKKIKDHKKAYDGEYDIFDDSKKNKSNYHSRIVAEICDKRIASLCYPFINSDNLFSFNPLTEEDRFRTEGVEKIINYFFKNKVNKSTFITKAINRLVIEGTVFLKTNWDKKTKIIEEEIIEEIPLEEINENGEYDALIQEALINNEVAFGEIINQIEKEVSIVNEPFIKICDFESISIDPNCDGNIEKSSYVHYSYAMSKNDLKEKYNLDEDEISNMSNDTSYNDDSISDKDKKVTEEQLKDDYIIVNEYWGILDSNTQIKKVYFIYVGDKVLYEEEMNIEDLYPFICIKYSPDEDTPYGRSLIDIILQEQTADTHLNRAMLNMMAKSSNGAVVYNQNAFKNDDEMKKFIDGDNAKVNSSSELKDLFYQVPIASIPPSVVGFMQSIQSRATSYSGIGETLSAQANSATSSKLLSSITSKQEAITMSLIKEGFISLCRIILYLSSKYLSKDDIFRITNSQDFNFDPQDMSMEYDIILDVTSVEETQEETRNLSFLLQTLGNTIPFDATKVVLVKLLNLMNFPDIAEEVRNINTQPSEEEIKMQQLQIAKAEAELNNEIAKGNENRVDAERKMADTEHTKVKTANERQDLLDKITGKKDLLGASLKNSKVNI